MFDVDLNLEDEKNLLLCFDDDHELVELGGDLEDEILSWTVVIDENEVQLNNELWITVQSCDDYLEYLEALKKPFFTPISVDMFKNMEPSFEHPPENPFTSHIIEMAKNHVVIDEKLNTPKKASLDEKIVSFLKSNNHNFLAAKPGKNDKFRIESYDSKRKCYVGRYPDFLCMLRIKKNMEAFFEGVFDLGIFLCHENIHIEKSVELSSGRILFKNIRLIVEEEKKFKTHALTSFFDSLPPSTYVAISSKSTINIQFKDHFGLKSSTLTLTLRETTKSKQHLNHPSYMLLTARSYKLVSSIDCVNDASISVAVLKTFHEPGEMRCTSTDADVRPLIFPNSTSKFHPFENSPFNMAISLFPNEQEYRAVTETKKRKRRRLMKS